MKHQPVRQGQTTTLGTTCPTVFDKCVGSLTSPANHVTLKMQETGPMVYSPYPKRPTKKTCYKSHLPVVQIQPLYLSDWSLNEPLSLSPVKTELLETDNVHKQTSLHTFALNGGCCSHTVNYYSSQ